MQDLLLQIIEIDSALRAQVTEAEARLEQAHALANRESPEDTSEQAAQAVQKILEDAQIEAAEIMQARKVRNSAELWALQDAYDKQREQWAQLLFTRCIGAEEAAP